MSLAKILLPSTAALAAALNAVPAAAAPHRSGAEAHRTGGDALQRDIQRLDNRVDQLEDRRIISKREAASLDRRVDGLERTWKAYARGGFTQAERRSLSARIDQVRIAIDRQARDHNGRVARR